MASSTLGALLSTSSTVASRAGLLWGRGRPGGRARLGSPGRFTRRSLPALTLVRDPVHERRQEALPGLLAIGLRRHVLRGRAGHDTDVSIAALTQLHGGS